MSQSLSPRQLRAIERIGDWMIPGDGEMPRFSELGCISQVARILDYMPASDVGDLKTLLTLLSFFPGFLLGMFLRLVERSPAMSNPLGGLLRTIRLGLRGLVMSLYYDHPRILGAIGYEVGVYTGDLES